MNKQPNVRHFEKILLSHPFLMSRKFETQDFQWYGVIWIKFTFADKGIKVWCSLLLPQVVLISSIKRTQAVIF